MDYILAGISIGGQYALIAIGYTMVYGILRLINFAHGDIFMVAGLMMVYAVTWMPLAAAIPFVLVMTMLLGFAVERAAYKPLRSAPRMSVMISAIGVSYMLQNVALYVTGGLAKTYPAIPWLSDMVTVFGATTKRVTLITPVLTIVLVAALVLLSFALSFACGRLPLVSSLSSGTRTILLTVALSAGAALLFPVKDAEKEGNAP